MSTTNFGTRVRIALIRRNMTVTELAERMGVSASYVRKIINGKRKAAEKRREIKTILNLKENSNEQEQKNGISASPQGRQNKNLGGPHLDEAAA